jgi:hypothetical protein
MQITFDDHPGHARRKKAPEIRRGPLGPRRSFSFPGPRERMRLKGHQDYVESFFSVTISEKSATLENSLTRVCRRPRVCAVLRPNHTPVPQRGTTENCPATFPRCACALRNKCRVREERVLSSRRRPARSTSGAPRRYHHDAAVRLNADF